MFEGTLAYPFTTEFDATLARFSAMARADVQGGVSTPATCPWCGSRGFVHNRPGPNPRAPWAVVCAGCEARGPTATTPGEAVERWDAGPTRPS